MYRVLRSTLYATAVLAVASTSFASSDREKADKLLQELRTDFKSAYLKKPEHQSVGADAVTSKFSQEQIEAGIDTVKVKGRANMQTVDGVSYKNSRKPGKAALKEDISTFLDEDYLNKYPVVRSIDDMDGTRKTGKVAVAPWSDTYWPLYQGMLGARYASSAYNSIVKIWKNFYEYVFQTRTLSQVINGGDVNEIDQLSPAEKYDLLIGGFDPSSRPHGLFTEAIWNDTKMQVKDGDIEQWMGICHGWAPAAFMDKRPNNKIQATLNNGYKLNFYPSDIKALSSYIWSKARYSTRFAGGRCNTKDPKRDEATGRIVSEECWDVNPATWHLAMVNLVGQAGRSFVLDATYDYEVWNQPIHSYSYQYFNPQKMEMVNSLQEAKVKVGFQGDKFANFRRNPSARYLVGVVMTLNYVVETNPSHAITDSPQRDGLRNVQYAYDLELDSQGNIIGGEWYKDAHPDFIWMPESSAIAQSKKEFGTVYSYDSRVPVSSQGFMSMLALQTAQETGMPLNAIVKGLINAAQ